ncbi:MAG: uncharacterized protein JWM69_1043 [Candidatus Binatus sp.]|nr:uncharacterized protein [Candidatus Binatus sp.]
MEKQGTTLLSESFKRIGDVALDERKRISMTRAMECLRDFLGDEVDTPIRFGVYVNEAGQILLSPELSVPMHELWLYRNPTALDMVVKGLKESREGNLVDLGSFEEFADQEIE